VELRQLRYFIAVAEELHFTRAAERLGITQPPLSQQIQRLESELGIALFTRDNRGVALTEAGIAFLDGARRTLAEADRALDDVARVTQGEVGSLTIGTVSSAWYAFLPRVLRSFREHYPDVNIQANSMSTTDQVSRLLTGAVDVALLRHPIIEPGISSEVIIPDTLVVAMPDSHRLATHDEVELSELAEEMLVILPRRYSENGYDLITQMCLEAGFKPRIFQETIEVNAVIGLVNAGMGLSIVPASISNLRIEGISYVPLAGDYPSWDLLMAWRKDNDSPVLQVFLDIARELSRSLVHEGVHRPRPSVA
jgi:DNA-binding transcriptional LysR family regulator